ncbi:MAG: 2-amino-4-hydroxy-6-hydroxymethyldihydropteridine diphosphokinase [Anaerolineales bacterium]|nr:2-amino-4-hydroxy-6-hydroxymethyldihydropteridine diphosphokinase [Anaerolineales bacterium]
MEHKNRVFIALGANLGNRLSNLRQAVRALPPEVHPIRISAVYETLPWGVEQQPAFLNAVLEAETALKPGALLAYLKAIEARLGRLPGVRYGPRLIDLDILFYEMQIVRLPGLEIPHPQLQQRAFVLVPMADLAPEWFHPILRRTVWELLQVVDQSGVQLYPDQLDL